MTYQLYRNTTVGNCLQETLDEMLREEKITPSLAFKILSQYDNSVNIALSQIVSSRMVFRGHLNTYRFCDNVWTIVLDNVEFREGNDVIRTDRVKFVACEGKNIDKKKF